MLGRCDTGQALHGRGKIPYPSNNCRAGAGYTGMFSCRGLLILPHTDTRIQFAFENAI
nr:MAG TPA: hypothetical protein [Caudoviricetes sp.]